MAAGQLSFCRVVTVALVAIGVGVVLQQRGTFFFPQTSPELLERVSYVIGDLHGDVDCGKYWVNRLGLVDYLDEEETKPLKWRQPMASLVFMGDYIDKGPYSYQTLLYVKSLTMAFPDKVTALMGNHELELLRDRHPETRVKYMQLAYSSVHPQEYLNFLDRDVDESDHRVVDLLLNASLEVYEKRWQNSVLVSAEVEPDGKRHAITELFDEAMRPFIQERIREYQASYLAAFASNTSLGYWVENLAVAHVENGVFFCHGGLSASIVRQILRVGGVDALNTLVRKNSNDKSLRQFLQETPEGAAVYDMLVYRGNHKKGACDELDQLLDKLGVDRLVVGHTPDENVRSQCSNRFWAVDSLLGRWIRTSGNYYCPISRRASQSGRFVCDELVGACQGQVVKISKSGVEIIS
jgi:hypothetical protein